MKTVFLGGTCNNSKWREQLISLLKINHFNPVVENWTPECQAKEIHQREICDFVLYTITPKMTGVYSIAEAVDDSNKRPSKTLFCVLNEDGEFTFNQFQMKSISAVAKMIDLNGGHSFDSLELVAKHLNGMNNE